MVYKGNSSIPLFKLINPWTKNKIGVFLVLLVFMLLGYWTGRIFGDRLSTSRDSGPVVINKGNSSIPLFKLINPWTKNKIGVTN